MEMTDASAQLPNNPQPNCDAATQSVLSSFVPYLSSQEFILSLLVILLTIVTLGFIYALLRGRESELDDITRLLVLVLIIGATLLLIVSGYSERQIAGAIGLFGAIVGYLLGKMGFGRSQRE
jgi:hypothetical protein